MKGISYFCSQFNLSVIRVLSPLTTQFDIIARSSNQILPDFRRLFAQDLHTNMVVVLEKFDATLQIEIVDAAI